MTMPTSAKHSSESEGNKMINFIKLKDDGFTEIKHLYHISDVHIRNTQRHDEYREVFERCYHFLRSKIDTADTVIVLTGDVMHAKTELSPEAIDLAYHLFHHLSEIAPVVVIPGNHDCNLSNRSRLDALTPIIENVGKIENLYYLKKSGFYQYHNLVFGVTSIFDDSLVSAKELPKYWWKKIKQKNKYKIALYHGPVHGSQTDVGYRMHNEQLLVENFTGYDYVLLGDIHKHQFLNKEKTVAYAGSLIQQSHGESLTNHGILCWHLFSGQTEFFSIKNDYGYCTVCVVDGKITPAYIPPKPRIRFLLQNTNQLQYQEIVGKLERKYEIQEKIKETVFRTQLYRRGIEDTRKNVSGASVTVKDGRWKLRSQEDIIRSYLKKKNMVEEEITSLIQLHRSIYQTVLLEKKDQIGYLGVGNNQRWNLLELQFSNTLSYGKNNIINFQNYHPNRIIGILAPNHYGKSNIIDIIIFCLFDRISRGDRRDIINANRNKMYCSLLLRVGDIKYLIERIGQRSKNGLSVKIDVNFYRIVTDSSGNEKRESLNGIDKNETNRKIAELVGDYHDYLTTCFFIQGSKGSNFLDMTQQQKKEYLNEVLKLNIFEDCHLLAKDKLKQLQAEIAAIDKKLENKLLKGLETKTRIVLKKIGRLEECHQMLSSFLSGEINYLIESLSNNSLVRFDDLEKYDLSSKEKIIQALESVNNKLEQQIKWNNSHIVQELKCFRDQLNDLEKKNSRDQQISLLKEKEQLTKNLVHLPDFGKNYDQLVNERELLENRMKEIDSLEMDHPASLEKENREIGKLKEKLVYLNKLLLDKYHSESSLSRRDMNFQEKWESSKDLLKKVNDLQNHLIRQFNELPGRRLNFGDREKINWSIKMKKSLTKYLERVLGDLSKYQNNNTSNDQLIDDIRCRLTRWIQLHQQWTEKALAVTSTPVEDPMTVFERLSNDLCQLRGELVKYCLYEINQMESECIKARIAATESRLKVLLEFVKKQEKIIDLKMERKRVEEQWTFVDKMIKQYQEYHSREAENQKAIDKIREIDKLIMKEEEKHKKFQLFQAELKKKINESEKTIKEHENLVFERKSLLKEKKLLERYYLNFVSWSHRLQMQQNWLMIKREMEQQLAKIVESINIHKIKMLQYKKKLEEYLAARKEFDEISKQINLYQAYVQMTNSHGLPYEVLKTYLPLIESDVNEILHSFEKFSIQMVYDSGQEESKCKRDNIHINILYDEMEPYNVSLVSGEERFIIGLAIRITLCQISLTAKPNFLVIDEGWNCLDRDNLMNISAILDYLKTQYEYIVIISHIEELKNQSDYIINIEKYQGYSYVNNQKN